MSMDIGANLDQMGAMLVDMAKVLAQYHMALLEEGVPEILANSLVIDFQRIMFTQRPSVGGDDNDHTSTS